MNDLLLQAVGDWNTAHFQIQVISMGKDTAKRQNNTFFNLGVVFRWCVFRDHFVIRVTALEEGIIDVDSPLCWILELCSIQELVVRGVVIVMFGAVSSMQHLAQDAVKGILWCVVGPDRVRVNHSAILYTL